MVVKIYKCFDDKLSGDNTSPGELAKMGRGELLN